jgi:isoquinoline 1-oxidoreductase beta subunit
LDADNNLIAYHVKAGGIPEGPLEADRFPAGAVDNYLAESWAINSNITTGSFVHQDLILWVHQNNLLWMK